jgi:glycosyltransferase involved in cell wall biosynthesis
MLSNITQVQQRIEEPLSSRVGFVTRRFSHHGVHTGYWLLASKWPGYKTIRSFPDVGECKGPGWIRPVEARLITIARGLAKCTIGVTASCDRAGILHVLYGENDLPIPRPPGSCRVVASLHQPVSYLGRDNRRIEGLRNRLWNVDLGIALSSEQLAFLQSVIPDKRFLFVPHGVDTDFFNCRGFSRERTVLISGGWLRDMDFAREVALHAVACDPELRVRVFGNNAPQLAGVSPRVEVLTSLTDTDLRREYSSCALMLLPLCDTVANNALLEALSCETPVVSPDLPGAVEYLGDKGVYYARTSSAKDVADLVCHQVEEAFLLPKLGLRERALDYDWSRIVSRMAAAYESTCA